MSISPNVKLNPQSITSTNPLHSDIESYCYAADDCDRYCDYLADKLTLEEHLANQHLSVLQA